MEYTNKQINKYDYLLKKKNYSSACVFFIHALCFLMCILFFIRDDIKLAQLVRTQDCQSRGRRFDSGKN